MIPAMTPFAWIIIGVGLLSLAIELMLAARTLITRIVSRRPEDQ